MKPYCESSLSYCFYIVSYPLESDFFKLSTHIIVFRQLADFVGSRKSLRELCCMSKQELKDLGKSKMNVQDPRKGTHQRFKFARGGHEDILGLGTKEDFVNEILYGKDSGMDQLHKAQHLYRLAKGHHHGDLINEEEEAIPGLSAQVDLPGDANMQAHERRLQGVRNTGFHGMKHLFHGPHGRGRGPYLADYSSHRRRRAPDKKEAPELVKARYGKWVKKLEDKPDLSQRLHQLGATSLRTFGYEPQTRFLDPPDETYIQQCRVILEENLCED